ncbi:class I fructose-bisphosphate aldolase [Telmatospirillum siberiense]|uniref:Fructose-bisphosphate aldolase n=1 Tax=Telmatospirillum siberiense TaxID=382514 RepID=A0A2N3PPQ9_9PROT|nr:fructose-bisphosphate aldolase [Telmatospirillum siberiense]PKU22374.1 fructose-bisphosphate aldolase [Telmatospirillum siberiense]
MLATVGKQRRLSRLINPQTGRGFCIAFDHALQLGPAPGLTHPAETLRMMAEAGVDAVILPLGSAMHFGRELAAKRGPALILRLDQTTMWREGSPLAYRDGHTRLIASVEDAVALGAEAVITYLFVAPNDPALETRSFEDCAKVNEAARRYGILHIIETMGARNALAKDVFDPDFVAFHARIGIEMGADIVKTDWPGSAEGLRPVTESSPVPVLIAGGSSRGSDIGVLELVAEVMAGGAAGILFGRTIFQAKNPPAVMRGCRLIIHDGLSAAQAARSVGL